MDNDTIFFIIVAVLNIAIFAEGVRYYIKNN